jgi:hypothetical protein
MNATEAFPGRGVSAGTSVSGPEVSLARCSTRE